MSKKSKGTIGATARTVNDLEKGRISKGLFFINGKWRKIKGATISTIFANGSWENILILVNRKIYKGNTLVSDIEY